MRKLTKKEISEACEAADRDTVLDKLLDDPKYAALSKESCFHTGFDVGFKASVEWVRSHLAAEVPGPATRELLDGIVAFKALGMSPGVTTHFLAVIPVDRLAAALRELGMDDPQGVDRN